MKVLFTGSVMGNSGPANVNRELVRHWPDEDGILVIPERNKILRLLDLISKLMSSDAVIVFSGTILEHIAISYMKISHKKSLVINHGYLPYENKINHLHCSSKEIKANKNLLANADVVVAVSRPHMQFLEKHQPDLIGHVVYINNAISSFTQKTHQDYDGHGVLTVAVSGGDRPIKGNEFVAKSVMKLREQGIDCRLFVFGDIDGNNHEFDNFLDKNWVTNNGQVSHSVFLSRLQTTSIFVMNSEYESFGLSAMDALEVGCPILLSSHCGVDDVLKLRECDVIEDNHDVNEISNKILTIAKCSNSRRLYQSINFDSLNWNNSAKRLRDICCAAVKGKDLKEFTL